MAVPPAGRRSPAGLDDADPLVLACPVSVPDRGLVRVNTARPLTEVRRGQFGAEPITPETVCADTIGSRMLNDMLIGPYFRARAAALRALAVAARLLVAGGLRG